MTVCLKVLICGNRPAIPENRLESLRKLSAKESGAGQRSSIQHTPPSDTLQLQLSLTSFAVVSILVCLVFVFFFLLVSFKLFIFLTY